MWGALANGLAPQTTMQAAVAAARGSNPAQLSPIV
jgi:hypothetical protein